MKVLSMLLIVTIIKGVFVEKQCSKQCGINWEIELVLAHEYCNKFFKCFNCKPLEFLCPQGLYFNLEYRQCDWKHNVNCSSRNIPKEEDRNDNDEITNNAESDSEEIDDEIEDETGDESEQEKVQDFEFLQNGCPTNPLIHWLLPHESDCNYFYSCLWGIKVKRQCPDFFHFNRKLKVCDWPGAAGCA